MLKPRTVVLLLVFFFLVACPSKQNGTLEGRVVPPNPGTTISVKQAGKLISSVNVTTQDGMFRMALAPGMYDISISSPSSPFPMSFPSIRIEPGKTTTLPLIEFSAPGASVLNGVISPGGSETKVSLLSEGKERAMIATNQNGSYEFMNLSPGRYTVQATSPGYAGDAVDINVSGDQRAVQNMQLLYISSVEGVDWATAKIRAIGKGIPPAQNTNPTVMREMAKRAALVDAQRNLLKILEQINVGPNRNLKSFLGERRYTEKVQGFVKGYNVVGERTLDDGRIEIELELPLTGQNGLSRYLID